jgi:hypothetical protein
MGKFQIEKKISIFSENFEKRNKFYFIPRNLRIYFDYFIFLKTAKIGLSETAVMDMLAQGNYKENTKFKI